MDKFTYKNFQSGNTDIAYDANKGYTEPTNEASVRKQLSYPLKEVKDYINNELLDGTDNDAHIKVSIIPEATDSTNGLMSASDKDKLDGIESGVKKDIWFGTCSTDDATLTKVITTIGSKDFELVQGNVLIVFFENKNTQNNVNLKVDGLTAKALYSAQDGATDMAYWSIDSVVMFVYDGTKFKIINRPNANSNAYGLVKVDQSMSSSSTNPVRNNVIKAYVDTEVQGIDGRLETMVSDVKVDGVSVVSDGVANVPTIEFKTDTWEEELTGSNYYSATQVTPLAGYTPIGVYSFEHDGGVNGVIINKFGINSDGEPFFALYSPLSYIHIKVKMTIMCIKS